MKDAGKLLQIKRDIDGMIEWLEEYKTRKELLTVQIPVNLLKAAYALINKIHRDQEDEEGVAE